MAIQPTIDEAVSNYSPDNNEPIDWQKDKDDILLSKINARIADSKGIHNKKVKEWREADAYFDGDPSKNNPDKRKLLYNPIFPIARNMTGLVTDAKPNPATRLVDLDENTPEDQREQMNETAGNLSSSLEEWWDGIRGQSRLQQWVLGLWIYADYYIMPYWDAKLKQTMLEALKPNRVHIDPNADEICNADYVVVDFYRSRQWMYDKYKDKAKTLSYSDYSEIRLDDDDSPDDSRELLKSVCKLQLYMEAEWWVYKSGNNILEKIRNPLWALDDEGQRMDIENSVRNKYQKPGVMGAVGKVVDTAKGMVGMETNEDKMMGEIEGVMMNWSPKKNYLSYPRIPIIQLDTYRLGGELYSRSVLKQTIDAVDNINSRKYDIQENSESLGKPNVLLDGKIINDDQAKRIETGKVRGEFIRMNTGDNKSLHGSFAVVQGVPVPQQFFEDIATNKREIDNVWGHNEVSRGIADPSNKTKGGILAIQEADQTPIRYVTRNLEDALQEIFEWYIQIRKIYKPGKHVLESGSTIDYDMIDQHFKVFMKSGSMMPVSKEAQRSEALELFKSGAIDPLTLHERLNDPEPEKTAKRLEMWIKQKTVMTDGMDDQQQRVLEKIRAIQANAFDQVQPSADDDPKTHHDMLLMALKSGKFSPEQEQVLAQLIDQYAQMADTQQSPEGGQPAVMANQQL